MDSENEAELLELREASFKLASQVLDIVKNDGRKAIFVTFCVMESLLDCVRKKDEETAKLGCGIIIEKLIKYRMGFQDLRKAIAGMGKPEKQEVIN